MLRSEHGHKTRKDKNSSWSILPRRSIKKQNYRIYLLTPTELYNTLTEQLFKMKPDDGQC